MSEGKHGHMLPMGLFGVIAAIGLMVFVPRLHAISRVMVWFAGFHVLGAAVLGASVYVLGGNRLARTLRRARHDEYQFGWEPAWMLGPWIAASTLLGCAIVLEIAVPRIWGLALLATLQAAGFFAGGLIARTTASYDSAVLPMVDLRLGEESVVLDAGCGSGRTVLALNRAFPQARIVALDRFDSGYIEGGGRDLLERNLELAGIRQRVEIRKGDITHVPFEDGDFDAVVSAHAMDHLGDATMPGLREVRRVLKPDGHFLLAVWIPGWTMFAVASVLSFHLAGKKKWRTRVCEAGFKIADEGMFNGYYFLVLGRTEPLD
ncbi:Methylase involved in ubiquinone/menaquinone biosynthesis-like protein [Candidatus Koribacter versatilis Ellin345]|uniref:Methylase involved in ubiquinone/menaquinone biosynthesis-like protein n=1 Tax=Koribacter versatilis (strain Ellin345) TaxID=204669 RepID=Q1IVS9_KORVE|nr:class I SAM-dependent methyltransferase [Candidatus Koribacter versatilis]ABF39021.1 Methylase involved in ubiquinone/menaquinone biosynthesis-like protein [Candidatus Koribacter versatilis Ellin345]